jgi:hypothetical protein
LKTFKESFVEETNIQHPLWSINKMARRFHDNNPNHSVLNLLLGLAATIALWNVWAAPSEEVQSPKATMIAPLQYLSISDGTSHRLLPVETINGHKVILISPHLQKAAPSNSAAASSTPIIMFAQHDEDVVSTTDVSMRPVTRQTTSTKNSKNVPSSRKKASKRNEPIKAGLGTVILVAISGAIIAGALMAKRALDKLQKWEQQSQEDSLAYDIAYTTTTSEVGYGSFVSNWTDDLDKFDV